MLAKLLQPRFPSCAVGIETDIASGVQLERGRGGFVVKRAASVNLPTDLVRANFDENNIGDPAELTSALSDLITSAGLLRQRKWSVALPEASARAAILTIEGKPGSRRELEEVIEWKIERSLGDPQSELRVTREQLMTDSHYKHRSHIPAIRITLFVESSAQITPLT